MSHSSKIGSVATLPSIAGLNHLLVSEVGCCTKSIKTLPSFALGQTLKLLVYVRHTPPVHPTRQVRRIGSH